jgi:hypothetical protein
VRLQPGGDDEVVQVALSLGGQPEADGGPQGDPLLHGPPRDGIPALAGPLDDLFPAGPLRGREDGQLLQVRLDADERGFLFFYRLVISRPLHPATLPSSVFCTGSAVLEVGCCGVRGSWGRWDGGPGGE